MTRLIIGNVVNRKVLGRDDDGDDWGDESLSFGRVCSNIIIFFTQGSWECSSFFWRALF